jgi:hypothetical protein
MGVPVLKKLRKKYIDKIDAWVEKGPIVDVNYPDNTGEILDRILELHTPEKTVLPIQAGRKLYSVKEFRTHILQKIAANL